MFSKGDEKNKKHYKKMAKKKHTKVIIPHILGTTSPRRVFKFKKRKEVKKKKETSDFWHDFTRGKKYKPLSLLKVPSSLLKKNQMKKNKGRK